MNTISNTAIIWLLVTAVLAVVIPLVLLLVWRVKTKCKMVPALCGAAIFVIFALGLESIPKVILLTGKNDLSVYILTHAWAFTFVGCLLAGVFEETGRFIAFRFLLKKYKEREVSVTYGIGHGGIEAMIIVGVNMAVFAVMAILINQGNMEAVLGTVPADQTGVLMTTMESVSKFGPVSCLMSIGERILAIVLHISLSVVVFAAVREKGKRYMFPVAIVLHMLFDVPAAMYQAGVLSIWVCELCILLFTITIAVFAVRLYHRCNL